MRVLVIISLLLGVAAQAQLHVPSTVVLTGSADSLRQVTGLSVPSEATDGLSAGAVRMQHVHHAVAQGTDQLTISLDPAPTTYLPGLMIDLVPSQSNTAAVTLNVNGLGAVPVTKAVDQALDSADLRTGVPVHLVHDGTRFQVVSELKPSCPEGYFPISDRVCIASTPQDPITFWNAITYCSDRNARLCTFAEWTAGCLMANGFFPTVDDYEWVDHAANDTDKAKRVGVNGTTLLPDCQGGGHRIPGGVSKFRCCITR